MRRALTHALTLFREDKQGGAFVATSSIVSAFRRGEAQGPASGPPPFFGSTVCRVS